MHIAIHYIYNVLQTAKVVLRITLQIVKSKYVICHDILDLNPF